MTFDEIIDELIDAGDLSLEEHKRVPADKRDSENYKAARDVIHEELSSIKDVEAVCYHESGHFVYAMLLGLKLKKDVTCFRVVGPMIEYHPPTDTEPEQYEPTPAAIKTPGLPLPYDNESLEELAHISVAGGESIHWFRPKQKRGNKNDYKRFNRLREMVFNRLHPINRHTIRSTKCYWKKAARDVRSDFNNGCNDPLIEAMVKFVMTDVFGSVFSNSNTRVIL